MPRSSAWRIETLFVLGLAPRSEYAVEIDDQEMEFLDTDAGGTLQVPASGSTDVGVRMRLRGPIAENVKATPRMR